MNTSQQPLCNPTGIECFKSMKQEKENCLAPCKGVFAGLDRDKDFIQVEDMEDFKDILNEYRQYKTGYDKIKPYMFAQEVGGNVQILS